MRYTAKLDLSRIANLSEPTDKELLIWRRAIKQGRRDLMYEITLFEKYLKDAGYLGWHDPLPDVYAVFEKVAVTPATNEDEPATPAGDRSKSPGAFRTRLPKGAPRLTGKERQALRASLRFAGNELGREGKESLDHDRRAYGDGGM